MSVSTLQDDVYKGLQGLSSIDSARNLLAQLNYDYASAPLRTDIPQTTRDMLQTGPQVIAQHGDFKVIHTRFNADRLPLGHQRQIITRLLPDNPYSLFLFSDVNDSGWHFVNVRHEGDKATRTFRRISIGPDERIGDRLRTPAEQLSKIAVAGNESVPPLELQFQHDRAFDVDVVTKRFYERYRDVFHRVESQVQGIENADERRIFTQRLFNRLMFVAFIQKKGWLKLNGQTDYLNALWDHYQRSPHTNSFYSDRLKNLFFVALDNPDGRSYLDGPNGNLLYPFIGDVPYLNGGLFEQSDHDSRHDVDVPDTAIDDILSNLFNRFNFTITESTPLDQEVAVDPEMLGKVFEELVTGRHESGSYYTPKPIVSFMCREALKAYLRSNLTGETPEAIERFVDDHEPDDLRNFETVLDALRNVTACDPACGSGAYILGMLHELLDLREALFRQRKIDYEAVYERKLEIIQNNLYGVDIDPFAINIARLRLWLSLAIDYEGEKPSPLPNLDYKIEVGDSLASKSVRFEGQMSLLDEPVRIFQQLKGKHLVSHGPEKAQLKDDIDRVRQTIISLSGQLGDTEGFQWVTEFAEVMYNGGFDIVLANPPYVRQELIIDLKPRLEEVYGPLFSGKADLYVFFYYRALQLLKPGGALAFISSNKWFRAAYGAKLRKQIANTTSVVSITDFGELPVFDTASTFPSIVVLTNESSDEDTMFTEVLSLDPPYPDVKQLIVQEGSALPEPALDGERWLLANASTINVIRRMETGTIPLDQYVDGQIYRGILTGFNQAFVIDGAKRAELIANDPRSEEIIKPFAVGDDVRKWRINDHGRWLIFTRRGIDIDRYVAVKDYLSKWRRELTPKRTPEVSIGRKPGNYRWYEIQDTVAYYKLLERPKIVFPDIAKEPRFALDDRAMYLTNTSYFIAVDNLFLLGLLNSEVMWRYCGGRLSVLGSADKGGRLRFFRQFVQHLPIPESTSAEREEIEKLVCNCRTTSVVDLAALREVETEINARVARLYGLPVPRTEI